MNEQTQQLIEKLAAQLGTTAEHLWGVMVRQAPISSATEAITLCIYAVLVVLSLRFVRKQTRPNGEWLDKYGSGFIAWMIWCAVTVLLIQLLFASLNDIVIIVAGFANPEYVALMHLLRLRN